MYDNKKTKAVNFKHYKLRQNDVIGDVMSMSHIGQSNCTVDNKMLLFELKAEDTGGIFVVIC